MLKGNWTHTDEGANLWCPVCGAKPGQQCSIPDPDYSFRAIEIGTFIHIERADACLESEEEYESYITGKPI